ncbi:hypothetical protein PFISCL1PPCAC_21750, partial [Pristionchus fissidentatus]
GNNVRFVLKLADKFDVKRIVDRTERWLIDDCLFDTAELLCLADQYNLATLQTYCIRQCDSFTEIAELINSDFYRNLSERIKDDLIVKMLELGLKMA